MVTFRNYDRRELQRSKQPCGFIPTYDGATPTRPGNAQYEYVFAGWTPELTEVTGDATYTATYKPTAKTEGINNAEVGETATKVIIDNQIFIRRGGNIYTIDGQRVQ